ncbi:MAG: bacterioferritin [candidate division NC10 bacterium]|nr:bacterioferritin [candidate division NC10 bacterium]MDE2320322.1 bacterioferritin [candidate division NC10 bacterium]
MQGHPQIIELLNSVLRMELTGINQYFLHSKMCGNWGYQVLAKAILEESIEEMKHADKVIARILSLDGRPNLSSYDRIAIGGNIRQQLENDLALEMAALKILNPGVKLCVELQDTGSRELLERITVDEERHAGWIEAQIHQIDELGYENYLAEQI